MPAPRKTSSKSVAVKTPEIVAETEVQATPVSTKEAPIANDVTVIEVTLPPVLKDTLEASLGKAGEIQEKLRHAAQESLENSKLVYARAREAAEDASQSLETSLKAATQGLTAFNVKTVEALQASADAQFAFLKALMATKSISDVIALQGEHARQQFETLNAAAKDMSNLIQKVSTETVEPIKSAISKSLKIAA